MKSIYFWLFSLVIILSIGCNKEEEPTIRLEDEAITNLNLTFSPTDGSSVVVFSFEDLGDASGLPSTVSSNPLEMGKEYEIKADLVSRETSPIKILTGKIRDAGTDYQLFMSVTPDNVFQSLEYTDMDSNGKPIGINVRGTTSDRFTTGLMKVTLIRNPDKSIIYEIGEGVPSGIGGVVEIEATFDVIIQ